MLSGVIKSIINNDITTKSTLTRTIKNTFFEYIKHDCTPHDEGVHDLIELGFIIVASLVVFVSILPQTVKEEVGFDNVFGFIHFGSTKRD